VQLRVKGAATGEWLAIAGEVKQICRRHGARLIVNDSVEIAARSGADGVHLGQQDDDPRRAREELGPDAIIGGTANTLDHIRAHLAAGVDYIGLGPLRHTTTKQHLSPVLGREGIVAIRRQCRRLGIELPLIAIGGIETDDLAQLAKTGIHGVAASSAVNLAPDRPAAAARFVAATKGWGDEALADRR